MGELASGIGSLVGGLFGHDTASKVQAPPQFYMPNQASAAQNAFQGIQGLPGTDIGQQTVPLGQQTAMNLYNNPGAAALLQGAQGTQGLGQMASLGQYGLGGALAGYGGGMLPYGQQLMQMGFDPQNALYDRTLGQVTGQEGAQLANSGVLNSPYGQGVMGNTLNNFNIDWQNNLLQRALSGAQGAGQLGQQAGGAIGQGTGLQTGAATGYGQFGAAPFLGNQAIGQGQFGALGGLQQVGQGAQGLAQTPIQDYLSYLSTGNQANQVNQQNFANQLAQAGTVFNQNQTLGKGIGQGLGAIGGSLFPSFGGFGGGMPGGGQMMAGTPWGR